MTQDAFDAAVDDATHAVLEAFRQRGASLPETSDATGDLMILIGDAVSAVMREDYGPDKD